MIPPQDQQSNVSRPFFILIPSLPRPTQHPPPDRLSLLLHLAVQHLPSLPPHACILLFLLRLSPNFYLTFLTPFTHSTFIHLFSKYFLCTYRGPGALLAAGGTARTQWIKSLLCYGTYKPSHGGASHNKDPVQCHMMSETFSEENKPG